MVKTLSHPKNRNYSANILFLKNRNPPLNYPQNLSLSTNSHPSAQKAPRLNEPE